MSFKLQDYQFFSGEHNDRNVIFVHFSYNPTLKNELRKKFPAAKWSSSRNLWYLPDVNAVRHEIGMEPRTESGKAVISQIHPVNQPALKQMHDLLILKGYSPNTVRTYCVEFAQLLYILKDVHVETLTPQRLRSYFLYCSTKLKLSENMIHSRMNAIKFYFDHVLKRENVFDDIPRPQKRDPLPKALSKSDVSKIFAQVNNKKHLMMLKLCYGMGLRVSEIVKLKISNIDSGRMMVHIENSKGKKDRYVALPSSILEELRNYFRAYTPKEYLFEGQYGGQYSIRSAQVVFKNAMKKAKINKKVGIHGLRHSYATHLVEAGTDMYFIMRLLGHCDIKTTEVYTKVSNRQIGNVKSPLDDL